MKRILEKMLICTLALILFLCIEVMAEAEITEGMVIGFSEEGIVLYADGKICTAAIFSDTMYDTEGELQPGDMITVSYSEFDGDMLIADAVICHRLHGIVSEIIYGAEPYLMLMPDSGEAVRVNLTEAQPGSYAVGVPVTVYYNGMRTRSVPPQITAQYIRGTMLEGKVSAVSNGSIQLRTDGGETVILHRSESTVVPTKIRIGNLVWASVTPQMRLSLPAQYEAQDILTINERRKI